jgi:hypothetical protein
MDISSALFFNFGSLQAALDVLNPGFWGLLRPG